LIRRFDPGEILIDNPFLCGVSVMEKIRMERRWGLLAGAVLVVFGLPASAVKAADESDWKTKALALNDITGEDPIRGQIKELQDDPAASKKLLEAALPLAKDKKQPFNFNAAYIMGRVALQIKDYDAAQVFFRICADQAAQLGSGQKLVQAFSGMLTVIDLLFANKKFEETAKLCQEFLENLEKRGISPRIKDDVLRRMIRALTKQEKVEEALKMTDNLIKARGNDWRNLELKGWIQREIGKPEESAKIYEDLLEKVGKDTTLEKEEIEEIIAEVHYVLSGVYVDMNQIDKASGHLKILLAKKPDDPTFNNDLGYIWADHDMNLDEAETMIRKALEEDRQQKLKANPDMKPDEAKENSAYLDSLGWVLYKKKKFQEAKPILLKAIEDKDAQHIEIYDHLGDVHLALGEKTEALSAWKKGVEAAGPSKREQERKALVEKKIKEHQP
jgi:tetratricopeptide (TPR) repeat protein